MTQQQANQTNIDLLDYYNLKEVKEELLYIYCLALSTEAFYEGNDRRNRSDSFFFYHKLVEFLEHEYTKQALNL